MATDTETIVPGQMSMQETVSGDTIVPGQGNLQETVLLPPYVFRRTESAFGTRTGTRQPQKGV